MRALLGHSLVVPCGAHKDVYLPVAQVNTTGSMRTRVNRPASQLSQLSSPNRTVASVALVVWHKDSQINEPIFAADARGADSLRGARQKVNSESLSGRARLIAVQNRPDETNGSTAQLQTQSPALEIDEAQASDAGLYTCTIEFDRAPTQTHRTIVRLIGKSALSLVLSLSHL